MGQLEMFDDVETIEPFKPSTTCARCSNIIGVRFQNRNLFFCTSQKGGRYGKKIKKSAPNCELFDNGEGNIPHYDGYYGGRASDGLKR